MRVGFAVPGYSAGRRGWRSNRCIGEEIVGSGSLLTLHCWLHSHLEKSDQAVRLKEMGICGEAVILRGHGRSAGDWVWLWESPFGTFIFANAVFS
jgi:hypothetical protein